MIFARTYLWKFPFFTVRRISNKQILYKKCSENGTDKYFIELVQWQKLILFKKVSKQIIDVNSFEKSDFLEQFLWLSFSYKNFTNFY